MSSSPTACAPAVAACRRTAPTRTPRAAAMPTSPSRGSARSTTADFHPPASARSCPSPSSTGSAPATAPPTTPAPTMPLKPIAVPPSSPLVAAPATTATTPSLRMLPPTVPRACPRIRPRACPRIRLSYRYPPLSPRQAARRRSARRPRVRRRRVGGVTICSPKNGEREREVSETSSTDLLHFARSFRVSVGQNVQMSGVCCASSFVVLFARCLTLLVRGSSVCLLFV